jgi:hypothetical protein
MSKIQLTKVKYTKKDANGVPGDITVRTIIPTFVPLPNMKALDVTDLSPEEQRDMESLYQEYSEYYTTAAKTLFSFEDWLSHTQGEAELSDGLKWRTFILENTEIVD